MKKLILLLSLTVVFTVTSFAQAPQALNYQAVIRGGSGYLLSNRNVDIKITIQQDSIGGSLIYSENHSTTTTVYGIINLAIGEGTILSGGFDSIPWADSDHYIKIEVDTSNSGNYWDMGTSQLLSVPYALEAEHASSLTLTDDLGNKYTISVDSLGNVIATPVEDSTLMMGLVGYWPFNGNANDESGKGNDGTVNGATLTTDRFGNSNSAYHFDGTDDYILVASAPSIDTMHSITISCWIYCDSLPGVVANTMIHKRANTTDPTGYAFDILEHNGASRLRLLKSNNSFNVSNYEFESNYWYHVVGIYHDSIIKYYINGEIDTSYYNPSPLLPNNVDMNIGCRLLGHEHFLGTIDDISIYNRALTENEINLLYNEGQPFTTCGDVFFDFRDGQSYNTVQIGTQCWLKENLNIGTMIPGPQDMSDDGMIEKYCYDNDPSNCAIYGGLYQWDEMMQYVTTEGTQGICPSGWHIPTDEEWEILEGTVDSQYGVGDPEWYTGGWRGFDAGYHLKSTTGWYSNGNGDDYYGFTALPGGDRHLDGSFDTLSQGGSIWSSTDDSGSGGAWHRGMNYGNDGVVRYPHGKTRGFSVRCFQD